MLTNVNPERIDRWCDAIDKDLLKPERRTELNAAIVEVVGAEYPNLKDKIALYIAAQEHKALVRNLSSCLYAMTAILEYRPEWIGAPIGEIALSAMRESAGYSSFHATAEALGCTTDKYDFEHILATLSKEKIVPTRFLALSDATYTNFRGTSKRTYGEHTLSFNFVSALLPTAEGEMLDISIPVYALTKEFSDMFDNEVAGRQLKKAWESWMALAQQVGHDDLHHMYQFGFDEFHNDIIFGLIRAVGQESPDLDPTEVFIRSLHARRMQYEESEIPKLMDQFLSDLIAFHEAMAPQDHKCANDAAFFLLCGAFDHAIADQNMVGEETLDAIENAMNIMQLTYRGEPIPQFYYDRTYIWRDITSDYERKNVGGEAEDYDGNGLLTGLPALWHAHIFSGTRTFRYAHLANLYDGEICFMGRGYVGAEALAKILMAAMYRDASAVDGLFDKMDKMLADDSLEPDLREQIEQFQKTWLSNINLHGSRHKSLNDLSDRAVE